MSTLSKYKLTKQKLSTCLDQIKNSPRFKKYGLPLIAAWIAYLLTLIPVSENLEHCKNCSPLIASGNQKLVIYNIENTNGTLLEYVAEPNEKVSIHFDKASLNEESLNLLSQFMPGIPKTSQPIDFRPLQNKDSKIFIKVMLRSSAETPNVLYLTRELTPNIIQPDFKIKADGLELTIEIAQIKSIENEVKGDESYLIIGNWHSKLTGIQLKINPVSNTEIAFRFDLPGWNPDRPFESFFIPSTNNENIGKIAAQGIGTILETNGNMANENLICTAPEDEKILWWNRDAFKRGACPVGEKFSPLKVSAFKIGKEDIQIMAEGNAWAIIKGELTNNVITLIKKYVENNPVLKQIFDKTKSIVGL